MNSVIKSAAYTLIHAPDMVIHNGTTQKMERVTNPESEYLKSLPNHLRDYKNAVEYMPNQVYIGNKTPKDLGEVQTPWYENPLTDAERYGKFGEIMPQDEFYLLMQICDVFNLVMLESGFVAEARERFKKHPLFDLIDAEAAARIENGVELADIEQAIAEEQAEGLYQNCKLVGCVKKAHDFDESLSAHVINENLVSKASCVLSLACIASCAADNTVRTTHQEVIGRISSDIVRTASSTPQVSHTITAALRLRAFREVFDAMRHIPHLGQGSGLVAVTSSALVCNSR